MIKIGVSALATASNPATAQPSGEAAVSGRARKPGIQAPNPITASNASAEAAGKK
jgi:hypothetical protein